MGGKPILLFEEHSVAISKIDDIRLGSKPTMAHTAMCYSAGAVHGMVCILSAGCSDVIGRSAMTNAAALVLFTMASMTHMGAWLVEVLVVFAELPRRICQ